MYFSINKKQSLFAPSFSPSNIFWNRNDKQLVKNAHGREKNKILLFMQNKQVENVEVLTCLLVIFFFLVELGAFLDVL